MNNENQMILCPACGVPKNNIKRFVLMERVICILIAANMQQSTYTCCAECMRPIIIRKTINTNIITANFIRLPVILPMHIIKFFLIYLEGHFKSITKKYVITQC